MLENNEVLKQINSSIKERLGSIMYGTFFISWLAWNWKIIYITFFIDQTILLQITGQLKIDYVYSFYTFDSFWIGFWTLIKSFLGPIVSTYIIIWWVSKIDFICAKKHYANKIEKEEEKIKQENKILNKKRNVLEKRSQTVKIQKDIQKEDIWRNELGNISKRKIFEEVMKNLEVSLYKHKGEITVYDDYNDKIFEIPPDHIAYLDVNELINFVGGSREKVELTDKGKFFLREFIKNKNRYT